MELQGSTHGFGATAHVAESLSFGGHAGVLQIEAVAIVLHGEIERAVEGLGLNAHFGGLGVFEGVGKRFFDDEKNVMPHFRGQRASGQIVGKIEPATAPAPMKAVCTA